MNKEEILNKYIDLIDKGYCSDCNELNCIDNFPHAKITHAIRELQQENQKLKKQLDYLRSGEYYNQLRFERDMLQDLVDKKEISKEDKEFIDMTHRNTELLEQNQKLKKQLEEKNKHQIFIDTQDMEERYAEGLYQDYLEEENKKYKNQQKEFIDWLENYLKLFDIEDIYEEGSYDTIEEILSKYNEIIEK